MEGIRDNRKREIGDIERIFKITLQGFWCKERVGRVSRTIQNLGRGFCFLLFYFVYREREAYLGVLMGIT